jgi:Polyketide cyclase / dehydrase and lipid transport
MSLYRQQAVIDASPERIWELVGDPNRHAEWWPRVIDVRCEGLEEGCTYRQVYKSPMGVIETDVSVERLDDCHELRVRCLNTGTYTRWLLTEAQGRTFIDAEFGLDPLTVGTRVFDRVAGKRYFRRWLEESLDALERVTAEPETGSKAA